MAKRKILTRESGLCGDAKSILEASRDVEEVSSRYKYQDSVFIKVIHREAPWQGEVLANFFVKYLINYHYN